MYNSLSSIFFYTLWYLEQLPYQYKVLDSCHWYTRSSYRAYSFFYFQLLTIIWWLFSTCRENVFYSQLETFRLAVRNISICSQKNFWLQRTGRVKQYPIGIATRKQGKRIITISYWRHLTNCPSVHRGTSEAEGVPNGVRRKTTIWDATRYAYNAPALRAPPL